MAPTWYIPDAGANEGYLRTHRSLFNNDVANIIKVSLNADAIGCRNDKNVSLAS
jgi:hypothetical protein